MVVFCLVCVVLVGYFCVYYLLGSWVSTRLAWSLGFAGCVNFTLCTVAYFSCVGLLVFCGPFACAFVFA